MASFYNECGGHRIQRIPPTETKGRVHTSTVTVALVDDAVSQVHIDPKDISIEWFSGSGAGGQHRNKHQNCIRILHIPSGIRVVGASERSRVANQKIAMEELDRRLNAVVLSSHKNETAKIRKEHVGSGMRGDKIRTYRFQDDTVVDHISNKSASVKQVMKGNFDLLWR